MAAPRAAIHHVSQQLVTEVERDLDLADPGVSLRVDELEAAPLQIHLGDPQVHHLADPKTGDADRRDHRSTPETLAVGWRLGLDLGGGVKQGVKLVDLEATTGALRIVACWNGTFAEASEREAGPTDQED